MADHPGPKRIAGRELRWLLTVVLFDSAQVLSLSQLAASAERAGFEVGGDPRKTISDALRWEIQRGRVVRVSRGHYAAGRMPRQTLSWRRGRIRRRLAALNEAA